MPLGHMLQTELKIHCVHKHNERRIMKKQTEFQANASSDPRNQIILEISQSNRKQQSFQHCHFPGLWKGQQCHLRLSVSCPALFHYFTHSSIVFALILTEHASCFRVCRGIRVWITKQWLEENKNHVPLAVAWHLIRSCRQVIFWKLDSTTIVWQWNHLNAANILNFRPNFTLKFAQLKLSLKDWCCFWLCHFKISRKSTSIRNLNSIWGDHLNTLSWGDHFTLILLWDFDVIWKCQSRALSL